MSDNYTQGQLPWVTHNSVRLENDNGDALLFKTRDGRPRFELAYNLTPEQKNNPDLSLEERSVTAPFDIANLRMFIIYSKILFEKNKRLDIFTADPEVEKSYPVTCLYHYDKNGNKSETKLERTKVTFYLDTDNIFKISITDIMYSGKTTVFNCGYTNWHIHNVGDKPRDPAANSRVMTSIYFDHLSLIMDNLVKNGGTVSYSRRPITTPKIEDVEKNESSSDSLTVEVKKAENLEDVNKQLDKLLAGN